MKTALIQQHATSDKAENVARGLRAFETAARAGAELVCFAELAFEPFYPQHPAGPGSRSHAEPVPGPITDAFATKARELGIVAVLNVFERDAERTFDCAPDGRVIARAAQGSDEILYADVDLAANARSHARRLFMHHRRPELYVEWFALR